MVWYHAIIVTKIVWTFHYYMLRDEPNKCQQINEQNERILAWNHLIIIAQYIDTWHMLLPVLKSALNPPYIVSSRVHTVKHVILNQSVFLAYYTWNFWKQTTPQGGKNNVVLRCCYKYHCFCFIFDTRTSRTRHC